MSLEFSPYTASLFAATAHTLPGPMTASNVTTDSITASFPSINNPPGTIVEYAWSIVGPNSPGAFDTTVPTQTFSGLNSGTAYTISVQSYIRFVAPDSGIVQSASVNLVSLTQSTLAEVVPVTTEPGPYEIFQRDLGPTWLQGAKGRAWTGASGATKDLFVDWLTEAVQARFVDSAPADALPLLADDRLLERFPNEPDATFRARIAGAWDVWEFAGTVYGLTLVLKQAGWRAGIVEHWRSIPPVEPWEDTVSNPADVWQDVASDFWPLERWSRFDVYVSAIAPVFNTTPDVWQDNPSDPGDTWSDDATDLWGVDYTPTGLPLNRVRDLIDRFKAAHSFLETLFVAEPASEFWEDVPTDQNDVWQDFASDVWTDDLVYTAA